MSNSMDDQRDGDGEKIAKLSQQVLNLIFGRQYDQAAVLLGAALKECAPEHAHRIIALTAVLQNAMGNLDTSIEMMEQAVRERREWLPHLYQLSVFLMDADRWSDASTILDKVISISEGANDTYFLDDARFRQVICLKALGREDESQVHKRKIAPDASAFIGSRKYQLKDLD